jgi:hypothetical protein
MNQIESVGANGDIGSGTLGFGDAKKEKRGIKDSTAEPLTTESIFQLVTNQLSDIGYHCSSMEKSEDFTERIDGILTKQIGSSDPEMSGYPRILTVYRVGGKIHVELYNFLKKFPTDNQEMDEAKETLEKMFRRNHSVEMDIHE